MAVAIDQAASAVDLKSEDLEHGAEEKNPLLSILPECDRDVSINGILFKDKMLFSVDNVADKYTK